MEAALIEEIRKRPYLYDTKNDKYKDFTIKDIGWAEISRELNRDCAFIKHRWKNLRDCYRQVLSRRLMTAGRRGRYWRPWRFEKEMEFIAPFMYSRALPSSSCSPERKDEEYHVDGVVFEARQGTILEDAPDYSPQNAQEVEQEDIYENNLVFEEKREILEDSDRDYRPKSSREERQEDLSENTQQGSHADPLKDLPEEEETWPKKRKSCRSDVYKLLKYLHEKKGERDQPDDLDLFFASACKSTKKLPRKFQNKIKMELLDSIVRAEEQLESDMSGANDVVSPVASACTTTWA